MRCGISTACFYPEDLFEALRQVAATGAPVTEIFLNTFSELEEVPMRRLADAVGEAGIRVSAIHPFTSMIEGFFFASPYLGRMDDGMRLYRRYFEACQLLGADKLVFHGDHAPNAAQFPLEHYARHFRTLAALGREYGVTLCHENVYYCRLAAPEDVQRMGPLLGDAAAYTLDVKQAQRQGGTPARMLDAMGGGVRHVHISDHAGGDDDCLPPGRGAFDFEALIGRLKALGYGGDLIIEVYRDSFLDAAQLKEAMQYVQSLLDA